jgi:hypothetical protein
MASNPIRHDTFYSFGAKLHTKTVISHYYRHCYVRISQMAEPMKDWEGDATIAGISYKVFGPNPKDVLKHLEDVVDAQLANNA